MRRASTITVLAAIAITGALARPANASAETARQVAEKTIDDVFKVLRATAENTRGARAARLQKLRVVVDRVFDWEQMAKRSLGVHWRSASAEQRARFLAVFKDLLADQYLDDMDKFRGSETVVVHAEEDTGGFTLVKSTLTTHSREKVPINYYFKKVDKKWWVHDISIEGVSLVNHYRKSFTRFLVNKSLDELLVRLERKRKK